MLITPNEILNAFGNAKLMCSISDGVPGRFDSRGQIYLTMTHAGLHMEGLLSLRPVLLSDARGRDLSSFLKSLYLSQLIAYAKSCGARRGYVTVIEFCRWPEVEVAYGRVYSGLTINIIPSKGIAKNARPE